MNWHSHRCRRIFRRLSRPRRRRSGLRFSQANVIYTMGVMGHFAGDASQPLHTTVHFNGWTGANPEHYTTTNKFHAWVDGGYIFKANVAGDLAEMKKKLRPAQAVQLNGSPA